MNISVNRALLLCWIVALLVLYGAVIFFCSSANTDYTVLYSSFRLLLEGKNIYTPVLINSLDFIESTNKTRDTLAPNLNTPFFALLFSPLGLLPYAVSYWVWSLLSMVFGMVAIVLIRQTEGRIGIDSIMIMTLLLLGYFPIFANILIGQTGLLLFMLVVGGWVAARNGRDQVGGVLLGLALAMKVFLGLFLLYFLVQRRWKLLSWLTATFAVCWLLGLIFLGLDTYVQYSTVLQSITWYPSFSWNASAYGFFTRIFGGSDYLPLIDSPLLGQALYFLLSLLFLILLLRLAQEKQGGIDPLIQFDLGFSYTLVAALLISPLGWMYYFPFLLIPFLTLFRLANSYSLGWYFKGAAIFSLFLSSFPQLLNIAPGPQFALARAAIYHYALLLLAALLVWSSRALQRQVLPLVQRRTSPAGSLADNHQLLYLFLGLMLYYAVTGMLYSFMV